MPGKDSEFLARLLAIFNIEAREHIDILFSGITELEKTADTAQQTALIEKIFREAHSLKGAARSVNLPQIEAACQSLENTFAAMKRNEIVFTPAFFDALNQSLKQLSAMLASIESKTSAGEAPIKKSTAPIVKAPSPTASTDEAKVLKAEKSNDAEASRYPLPDAKPPLTTTARISTAKLDAILLQTEEMLAAKLLAQQRYLELREINELAAAWEKDWAGLKEHYPDFYRMAVEQPRAMELLQRNSACIETLLERLDRLTNAIAQDQRVFGRMVDELLGSMKEALMLPFSTLTETFPRMVQEFARDAGKAIDLEMHGGDIVADRRILEEIKDPLLHLLRNCIDHGIEKPEQRISKSKRPKGTISITFAPRSGNRVEISIADDGAGIDIAKVKATAERLGLLSSEQSAKLDRRKALELVYLSGISTSPIITEISGRGLGLAIVQEKVDKLGGAISLDSQEDTGTVFRIELPLIFATYRGIVVRVGERRFVLPTVNAEQTLRISVAEIRTVENRETISLHGEILSSLVWLADALGIPRQIAAAPSRGYHQIIILNAARKRIAFVVDEVLEEQEVLVKNLGKQLARVRNIAGATILASGKVVPVLNVSDLMKSALQAAFAASSAPSATMQQKQPQDKSVLVVEDSITARSLLKGILESAGYRVATAVDGIDGLTQLRSCEFDIVVSDVDMPRMNGFDLTAKIRSDKKLAELPVVLVTALASREDRERGIDVGANAYIVKSSFEQSNLLAAIQRLI